MTFEQFFDKYKLLLAAQASAQLEQASLREDFDALCREYPDFEFRAEEKLWEDLNKDK